MNASLPLRPWWPTTFPTRRSIAVCAWWAKTRRDGVRRPGIPLPVVPIPLAFPHPHHRIAVTSPSRPARDACESRLTPKRFPQGDARRDRAS